MKNKEILFLAKFGLDPISYNAMYVTVRHRGGRGQHTFMADHAIKYETALQETLARYFVKKKNCKLPRLKENELLTLTMEFGIDAFRDKEYKKPRTKDNSNFIKPVEDAISNFIGIDDSYNFEVITRKLDYKKLGLSAPFVFMYLEITTMEEVEDRSKYVRYLKG